MQLRNENQRLKEKLESGSIEREPKNEELERDEKGNIDSNIHNNPLIGRTSKKRVKKQDPNYMNTELERDTQLIHAYERKTGP